MLVHVGFFEVPFSLKNERIVQCHFLATDIDFAKCSFTLAKVARSRWLKVLVHVGFFEALDRVGFRCSFTLALVRYSFTLAS